MVNISFSWDDGAIEDLKLMDLSLKYDIPGIFFIPATNPERDVLSEKEIKILADNDFEIGAHTYSHSYLTQLSIIEAKEEMVKGKLFLEQLLGKRIPHFCFPGGKLNSDLVNLSMQFFKSARTADTGALLQNNSYLIRPSFHFYNRGKKSIIYNSLKNNSVVFRISLQNIMALNYFDLIKNIIFDLCNTSDNHKIIVWGHSWEIEEFKLWGRLEDMFQSFRSSDAMSISRYSDLINKVYV